MTSYSVHIDIPSVRGRKEGNKMVDMSFYNKLRNALIALGLSEEFIYSLNSYNLVEIARLSGIRV